jgi:hypothetical protein
LEAVTLPRPEPGLVIRYSYLWLREYREGREEGIKDRPCAIVICVADEDEATRVTVLPVTHSPPQNPAAAVEIPQEIKQRLGLDAGRSWVTLDEGNEFIWPGPDLRPVPGADPASVAYGFLPPRFFSAVRGRFLELARQGRARGVKRTE